MTHASSSVIEATPDVLGKPAMTPATSREPRRRSLSRRRNSRAVIPSLDGLRRPRRSSSRPGPRRRDDARAGLPRSIRPGSATSGSRSSSISGFLITTLLLRERAATGTVSSLRNFYVRRTLRIFPAFYAYLAVMVVLHLCGLIPLATLATSSTPSPTRPTTTPTRCRRRSTPRRCGLRSGTSTTSGRCRSRSSST